MFLHPLLELGSSMSLNQSQKCRPVAGSWARRLLIGWYKLSVLVEEKQHPNLDKNSTAEFFYFGEADHDVQQLMNYGFFADTGATGDSSFM